MDSNILQGQWSKLRGTLRNNWSELTDQDIKEISGKSDLLIGKLQERYGYSRSEAERRLHQFINRYADKLKSYTGTNLKHIASTLNTQVKKSPWTVALIGGIGGLLIGLAVHRKTNRSSFRNFFKKH